MSQEIVEGETIEDREMKEAVVRKEEIKEEEGRSTTMKVAAGHTGALEEVAVRLCTIGSLLQASPWLLSPHGILW